MEAEVEGSERWQWASCCTCPSTSSCITDLLPPRPLPCGIIAWASIQSYVFLLLPLSWLGPLWGTIQRCANVDRASRMPDQLPDLPLTPWPPHDPSEYLVTPSVALFLQGLLMTLAGTYVRTRTVPLIAGIRHHGKLASPWPRLPRPMKDQRCIDAGLELVACHRGIYQQTIYRLSMQNCCIDTPKAPGPPLLFYIPTRR